MINIQTQQQRQQLLYFRSHQVQVDQFALKYKNKQASKQTNKQTKNPGVGEVVQWLRALAALPEDLCSISSTHMEVHNYM
jgi:flagellar basal body P-ring protein FlgI